MWGTLNSFQKPTVRQSHVFGFDRTSSGAKLGFREPGAMEICPGASRTGSAWRLTEERCSLPGSRLNVGCTLASSCRFLHVPKVSGASHAWLVTVTVRLEAMLLVLDTGFLISSAACSLLHRTLDSYTATSTMSSYTTKG